MTRLMPAPSDARAFTIYHSAGQMEDALQRAFDVRNENEYRSFLQRNPGRVDTQVQMMVHKKPDVFAARGPRR